MLYWSGARISEVLNLTVGQVHASEKIVIIESLKKRKKGVFRQIPLPNTFIKEIIKWVRNKPTDEMIWKSSRRTVSRHIKKVMKSAGIFGPQASAKGLRHSFAVHCVTKNIPLTLIKKWMGHASISTTAIYLDIVGMEERKFAERIWDETR